MTDDAADAVADSAVRRRRGVAFHEGDVLDVAAAPARSPSKSKRKPASPPAAADEPGDAADSAPAADGPAEHAPPPHAPEAPANAPVSAAKVWLLSCALGVAALAAYVRTLCPSVPGGDSGELVQLAVELGVAHPPGYPTWTMMAHAFSRLPFSGEVGWRVNLSSAVCDALASTLLSAAVGLWSGCAWAGVAAGGAFAFSPLVWQYATQGEVFALNNLCNALLFYLLVRFEVFGPSVRRGCAGAAAIGLALSNQHTMVFFCVPYALWSLGAGRSVLLRPLPILALCVSGLVGLSPYAYLPLMSGPDAAWGSWGDQTSVAGFLTHVLRKEYGTFKLANIPQTTDAEYILRVRRYLGGIPTELPALGAPLLLLGLASSLLTARRGRTLPLLLPAAYVLYVLIFNWLSNLPASSEFYLQVQQRFWPQAHLMLSVWYGLGLRSLVSALSTHLLRTAPTHLPRSLAARMGAAGLSLAMPLASIGLVASHAYGHYGQSDQSGLTIYRDFGMEVLRTLPDKPNVLLLTLGDEVLNSIRYVHRQLGMRPQLRILDQNYAQFGWFVSRVKNSTGAEQQLAAVTFPGTNYGSNEGGFYMRTFLDENYPKFSIFVCGGLHKADTTWMPMAGEHAATGGIGGYRLWPLGMVMQVLRHGTHGNGVTIKLDKWASKSAKLLPKLSWAKPPAEGSWEEIIAKNHYLPAYIHRPFYVLNYAYEVSGGGDDGRPLEVSMEARERFMLSAKLYQEHQDIVLNGSRVLPDYYYRNMGVAFSQLIVHDPTESGRAAAKQRACSAFMRYLRYDTITPADRTHIEHGVLALLPPPGGYAGGHEGEERLREINRRQKDVAKQRARDVVQETIDSLPASLTQKERAEAERAIRTHQKADAEAQAEAARKEVARAEAVRAAEAQAAAGGKAKKKRRKKGAGARK